MAEIRKYCSGHQLITAPPLYVFQSPPDDEFVLDDPGADADAADILEQQELYFDQIAENGVELFSLPGSYLIGNTGARPSWKSFSVNVTSVLQAEGTGRIVDFAFTRTINEAAENAYVRNVILSIQTTTGIKEYPFQISNVRAISCFTPAPPIHPVSSSGQTVHTYEFIEEVTGILNATITFDLSDDWYCLECCGDIVSGVEVDLTLGLEII
jgi:hypothetical protein